MKKTENILYGGDYNPNQWEESEWEKDLDFLKKAGINSVTINVFSWARLQPQEDVYDFSQLDKIIDKCSEYGMDIVLGTATAALPAWMVRKYPEVSRVDFDGRKRRFGKRHNACPNSPVYQKYARALAEKLAERYGKSEAVKLWHVNNEYGGACFCENCEKEFRNWLKKRYGTLEKLNDAWNMEFWGHLIYDWDEIIAPNILSEANAWDDSAFEGLSVDYRRFNSESLLNNFRNERDAIRKYDTQTPITTNLMGTYKTLDYFKWGKEMDVVSWDNYPSDSDPCSLVAMKHDIMRGLKAGAPFLVMEQNPTQQTFEVLTRKEPGKMRAWSYQAMAHGADGLLFFQLKNSRGANEKYCGSVIGHVGHRETRVYQEVQKLGAELQQLGKECMGAVTEAHAAVLFDWESYWSIEYDRNRGTNKDIAYVKMVQEYYHYFYEKNIPVDVITTDQELAKYSLIIAPGLYMVSSALQKKITDYVNNGGAFVTTYMSGIVDETTNVILGGYPGAFREILGIWVEEMEYIGDNRSHRVVFSDGSEYETCRQCDIIHCEGASPRAFYRADTYYDGVPAITQNNCGNGRAYYIGTGVEKAGLFRLFDEICNDLKITPLFSDGAGLEISMREKDGAFYYFLINHSGQEIAVPQKLWGKENMLDHSTIAENQIMRKFDVIIVRV